MDVHHLRYFVSVADAGTIAGAAEYLGVSPSPLSRRIRDLEAYMGEELFTRSSRGLRLTALGTRLLPVARRTLAAFAETEALRTQRPVGGPLRFGLVPGIEPELSALVLRTVHEVRPGASVDFVPADSPTQHEYIRQGRLDLATIRRAEVDVRLESLHLVEGEIVPCVAGSLAEILSAPLEPNELRGWTVVLSYQPTFSESLSSFIKGQGIEDFRIVPGADSAALGVLAHAPQTLTFGQPDALPAGMTALQTSEPLLMETRLVWRKDRRDLDDIVHGIEKALAARA